MPAGSGLMPRGNCENRLSAGGRGRKAFHAKIVGKARVRRRWRSEQRVETARTAPEWAPIKSAHNRLTTRLAVALYSVAAPRAACKKVKTLKLLIVDHCWFQVSELRASEQMANQFLTFYY